MITIREWIPGTSGMFGYEIVVLPPEYNEWATKLARKRRRKK
jgi:hypothetical protein